MFRKMKKRENGFTLVEIIASIVILGILVVFLLPAFPNIMSGSSDAEDKMVTGNLLTKVVEDIENDSVLQSYVSSVEIPQGKYKMIPKEKTSSKGKYVVDGKAYKVILSIQQTKKEKEIGIVRTKIKITSPSEKESSETFAYLDNKGE